MVSRSSLWIDDGDMPGKCLSVCICTVPICVVLASLEFRDFLPISLTSGC